MIVNTPSRQIHLPWVCAASTAPAYAHGLLARRVLASLHDAPAWPVRTGSAVEHLRQHGREAR